MILLESCFYKVVKIKKKTKACMFKDLKIGDELQFSIPIQSAGSNRGTYASYIKIACITNGNYTTKSFNQIGSCLNNFELEELIW
jgi:hypothetical protein